MKACTEKDKLLALHCTDSTTDQLSFPVVSRKSSMG